MAEPVITVHNNSKTRILFSAYNGGDNGIPYDTKWIEPNHQGQLKAGNFMLIAGRFQDAQGMAQRMLARNPKNENYRLKLLEAYYAAKNRAGFDLEAQALNESSSGSPSPVWDRVMIMGRDLSPHNPLFYGPAIGGLGTPDSAVAPSEPADASGDSGRQEDVTAVNTGAGGIVMSEQIVLNTENAVQPEWAPSDLPHARVEGHKLRHYQ